MGSNGSGGYTGPFPNVFGFDHTYANDPPQKLTDADVARIADAVAERLRPSRFDVSPAELRHYLRPRPR